MLSAFAIESPIMHCTLCSSSCSLDGVSVYNPETERFKTPLVLIVNVADVAYNLLAIFDVKRLNVRNIESDIMLKQMDAQFKFFQYCRNYRH